MDAVALPVEQTQIESSTIVEPEATVARLIFVPLYLLT